MPRLLCIWFPHWPLQRVMVARPELKGRAVVLTEPHPRGGERVIHASRAAAALGVRPGMSVAETMTLARQRSEAGGRRSRGTKSALRAQGPEPSHAASRTRHSALEPIPADPIADRHALIRLAHWCHRFSPTIGLEEAERPESLLLDVSGIGRLFGGEDRLLEQAAGALSAQGYRVHLAIANTIGAAWAVAHFKSPIHNPNAPLPNLQSLREDTCNLQSLPLAALRLPEETIDQLAQFGIHRIAQLTALPRAQLDSRFGSLLLRRLDQTLGTIDEVIQPIHGPPDLSAEWPFETPTTEPDVLEAVIGKLLGELTQRLLASGRGATQLTCRLDLQDAQPLVLDVGLYRPTATARHLQELICMQRAEGRLPSPVEGITITILAAQPLGERQQELFDNEHARTDQVALARLIDRLASRLGHHGVVRPRLVHDAQAELAVGYDSLVGATDAFPPQSAGKRSKRLAQARPAKPRAATESPLGFRPLERPLHLLPRPVPICVISLLPDGPPAQFVYRGDTHRVARHWGPERIETGWWRDAGIRRDYWRIETATGARYWLFRRLGDLVWFLHGVF